MTREPRSFAIGLFFTVAALQGAAAGDAGGPPEDAVRRTFDCVMDPSKSVKLGSPVLGVLSEILVQRGNQISKGQALARLDSRIEAATVQLNRARALSTARVDAQQARLDLANARISRSSGLVERNIVTRDKFEELSMDVNVARQELLRERQDRQQAALDLDRSEVALDERTIRSPLTGIVSEEHLSAGEFVPQDGYIMRLAQLDPLNVEAFLPVTLFTQLHVGSTGIVRPNAPIGGEYSALVTVVDRVFDAASGTFGVRLTLPNPGNQLPAGQRCTVTFDGTAAAVPGGLSAKQ